MVLKHFFTAFFQKSEVTGPQTLTLNLDTNVDSTLLTLEYWVTIGGGSYLPLATPSLHFIHLYH